MRGRGGQEKNFVGAAEPLRHRRPPRSIDDDRPHRVTSSLYTGERFGVHRDTSMRAQFAYLARITPRSIASNTIDP